MIISILIFIYSMIYSISIPRLKITYLKILKKLKSIDMQNKLYHIIISIKYEIIYVTYRIQRK